MSSSISWTQQDELVVGAGLSQDGAGHRTGRGGRDDVGDDPFHAHQVLQGADFEGALGAAAGQYERGGAGQGCIRHGREVTHRRRR